MNVIELPKSIQERCKKLNIKFVQLSFSGGNDEGYLSVYTAEDKEDLGFHPTHSSGLDVAELRQDIENWAWDNYGYSGAGDGNDYGDEIVYDLEKSKASHTMWAMQRHEERPVNWQF